MRQSMRSTRHVSPMRLPPSATPARRSARHADRLAHVQRRRSQPGVQAQRDNSIVCFLASLSSARCQDDRCGQPADGVTHLSTPYTIAPLRSRQVLFSSETRRKMAVRSPSRWSTLGMTAGFPNFTWIEAYRPGRRHRGQAELSRSVGARAERTGGSPARCMIGSNRSRAHPGHDRNLLEALDRSEPRCEASTVPGMASGSDRTRTTAINRAA